LGKFLPVAIAAAFAFAALSVGQTASAQPNPPRGPITDPRDMQDRAMQDGAETGEASLSTHRYGSRTLTSDAEDDGNNDYRVINQINSQISRQDERVESAGTGSFQQQEETRQDQPEPQPGRGTVSIHSSTTSSQNVRNRSSGDGAHAFPGYGEDDDDRKRWNKGRARNKHKDTVDERYPGRRD
jgi:hypothetical protein